MDKKVQWAGVAALWFLAIGLVGVAWLAVVDRPASHQAAAGLPDRAVCPVTGRELKVTEKTPRARFQGRDYFFAQGEDTLDADGHDPRFRFLMDPNRWVREGN